MGSKVSRPTRQLKNTIVNSDSVTRSAKAQLPPVTQEKPQLNQTPQTPGAPEGRDGMDPQADAFVHLLSLLGKLVQSTARRTQPANVTALKQLLSRKALYEKGQQEREEGTKTMLHPQTLTAIVSALHDGADHSRVASDFNVEEQFLANLARFKVANNVVVVEETTKADEIGPKAGQPVRADDAFNYDETEGVEQSRLETLKKRLE